MSTMQARKNPWGQGGDRPLDFTRSFNPIPIRGANYAHHITTRPTRFSHLPTALNCKAELAQVGTFFPARISALASKMGQIKKIKTYCHAN